MITSKETIKPSSPTPPHLKTHVLSLIDNNYIHEPLRFVFFYKNYNDGDTNILKKSLSQCLTQYYPFAGRLKASVGQIECNDEGVDFFEADHDSTLEDFILNNENEETLHQLHPDVNQTSPKFMHVQLNHLNNGVAALAVSISHKVADAFTVTTFMNQWAKVARGGSPFKPNFFTSSMSHHNNNNVVTQDEASESTHKVKYVTKSFVFPNSKLIEIKNKIISMGVNPPVTRVEALTSVLFKCSVNAATTKSGFFEPSILDHPVNMRNKIFNKDPEKAVGNIVSLVIEKVTDWREIVLDEMVARLKKGKMECKERDVQEIGEKYASIMSTLEERGVQVYIITSFCWFPLYEVDFGWGKPVQVKYVIPNAEFKNIVLMDTPERDGIEAIVHLPEEQMMIFQHDKELIAYIGD